MLLAAAVDQLDNASHQRAEVIGVAIVICLLIFELVRRKHLMERYALLWLASGATILVFAFWQGLLTQLSHLVGIYYPPAALFVIVFVFVLALLVHFSVTVSRLSTENKMMAQRIALLMDREGDERPPTPGPGR